MGSMDSKGGEWGFTSTYKISMNSKHGLLGGNSLDCKGIGSMVFMVVSMES